MKRGIKKIHKPFRDDIADLRTVRPLPNPDLAHLDPFLFLNHHGHQIYAPHNRGLPFAPHPHRGFETVTVILQGEISHRDSAGNESTINAGGVQWMTAGKGIIHEEISSKEFKEHGGDLEILQLWLNLPSHLKMTEPKYIGLEKGEIPVFDTKLAKIQLIAGNWAGHKGAISPLTEVTLLKLEMEKKCVMDFNIPESHNIFFYLIKGSLLVNEIEISSPHLVEFNHEGVKLELKAKDDSVILLGHAAPFCEPIVSHGPFVMNTREEIIQAIRDYQEGRLR